ncbi:MAG: hypothetical protein IPJ65_44055 [Archangiaceae bacterium]|nr:hypothetical protein [Archangiaceae bacterium]
MTSRSLTVLLATALCAACTCLDGGGGTGGGGEAGGGEGGGTGLDLDAGVHYGCSSETTLDEPLLNQVLAAADGPFPDGDSTVPIADGGCFRVQRTASGGALTHLALARYSGKLGYELVGTEVRFFEQPDLVPLDLRWSPGLTLKVDSDFDGFAEDQTTETLDATGLSKQENVRFSPSTKAVLRRSTMTRVNATTVHFKDERTVSGTLTTVADFDAAALQKQSGTCAFTGPLPNEPDQVVACPDEAAIRAQLLASLNQGITCMLGAGIDDVSRLINLRQQLSKVDITCFKNRGYAAAVDVSRPGGRIPLRYNADLGTCMMDFQLGTLFHELIHLIQGPHDSDLEHLLDQSMNVDAEQYAYLDRMRSCERLCFGTLKTRCACAVCFQTGACDQRCGRYNNCVKRVPNDAGMNVAVMSEAVAAVCQSDTSPGVGEVYKTMTECRSNCGAGSTCKSKSVSCDPNCQ